MLCLRDRLAAYQFDVCVVAFGTLISNKLQERDEVDSGGSKQYLPRYSLAQLLDPAYALPHEGEAQANQPAPLPVGTDGAFYDEVT